MKDRLTQLGRRSILTRQQTVRPRSILEELPQQRGLGAREDVADVVVVLDVAAEHPVEPLETEQRLELVCRNNDRNRPPMFSNCLRAFFSRAPNNLAKLIFSVL